MSGVQHNTTEGMVEGIYLATVPERHYLCSCVWAYDGQYKAMRLKYRDASCMAISFHLDLEHYEVNNATSS